MDIGHNSGSINEQDREVLFFVDLRAYNKAMAAKKAADAEVKRVGKVVKADLGPHGIASIKTFLKAQTEEGAQDLREEAEAKARAMRYAGTPSGYQFDLLIDRTPLIERAAIAGRKAGLLGETLANPYNEASEEGQAYANAWHGGQADLAAGIKKKEEAAAAADDGDELISGADVDEEPVFEEAAE